VGPSDGTRFVIDAVYEIMAIGCVLTGKVESGVLHVPGKYRLTPGPGSATVPCEVEVRQATAHRQEFSEVPPGLSVGLQIRGVPRHSRWMPGMAKHRYEVRKGDVLEAL
jgi:translation elongation factor EF-1alpha